MDVLDTALSGLKIIKLQKHGDSRGFFVERYAKEKFAEAGLPTEFVQDNHSRSSAGVLRGLHYQYAPPQGKLVGVTRGRVWDVAVDVRTDSPTFGQHVGVELSDENATLFWMPAGFAHGFCVLGSEPADMLYKVTGTYNAQGEGGLMWNDPELAVAWPLDDVVGEPIISDRDYKQETFAEYKAKPVNWNNFTR